MLTSNICKF